MIVQKFEEQVSIARERIAIKTTERTYTFGELNEYADRVAHIINESGAGDIVALFFEHGVHMIASILGALKAGKIYVPLSVDYPVDRLSYMLKDSTSSLIVSNTISEAAARDLGQENSIPVVNIDNTVPVTSTGSIRRKISGDKIAYIMYTSGSTGQPKGVVQLHENVLYFTRNWISMFSITENDRMTLFSSFSHDGSVQDVFSALFSRATLYPMDMKKRESVTELAEFLTREKITIWHSVPTLFRYFTGLLNGNEDFQNIRYILLGGEMIRPHDAEMAKTYFPHSKLAGIYGQTESSVNSICFIPFDEPYRKPLVGIPFEGTGIFVVDEEGTPVEPLKTGEILVASPHITPGYWKKDEINEKVFSDDEEFGRLYWTGDLGRLLVNGDIEFLGRKDFQVKIRGFRIELGEIESRLLTHPSVKEAVVTVRTDKEGDSVLCAYIVRKSDGAVFAGNEVNAEEFSQELKTYAARFVPDYMVPTHVMVMESMPLTGSGKTDRNALPDPVTTKSQIEFTAPRNDIEKKLAKIWSELLGIEEELIGIDDNFFRRGGHSLKATVLVSRIHREFKVKIPLISIFNAQSIRELAKDVGISNESKYTGIEPVEEREYYDVSSAQMRLFILQEMNPQTTVYNMPIVFPMGNEVDREKLISTLHRLIDRHESLRTSFEKRGETLIQQRVHRKVEFQVEYFEPSKMYTGERLMEEVARIINGFVRPFDLSCAPLIRSGIIHIGDESDKSAQYFIWLLDIHHIITDGTSNTILTRDFLQLYNDMEMEPLRLQYKDFSQWQNHVMKQGEMQNQFNYWLEMFQGEIPRLDFPGDFKRPEVFTYQGDNYSFMLDTQDAIKLRETGTKFGATLYMMMLAALNTLFYRYTDQEDIVVGSVVAARPHADLQHIIGMFVNTLAMRNFPTGEKAFDSFLKEVIESSIRAFENQDVQFEELVDRLQLERDMSRNPLFDISLVVQNFMDQGGTQTSSSQLPSANDTSSAQGTLPAVQYRNTTSKFDLTFYILENGDDILVRMEYYTPVFKIETIKRLASHFIRLIKSVIESPSARLKDLDILLEEEREQLVYRFNDTFVDYPSDKTVSYLFEEQVRRSPDSIVVIGNSLECRFPVQLSFRELDERSGLFASRLLDEGAQPGDIIPVMIERSVEMLTLFLGILKTGSAYLPIDTQYPKDRIDYMLKDSNAGLFLTAQTENSEKKRVILGEIGDRQEKRQSATYKEQNEMEKGTDTPINSKLITQNSKIECAPAHTCYIIYTSGTTGKPKGVMVTHEALVNLCNWHIRYFDVSPLDRATQVASIAFDASVWEIFPNLVAGASLHIITDEMKLDIVSILDYFKIHCITISFLPTPLCEQLMETGSTKEKLSLRRVLTGGDKLNRFIPQEYDIYNNYGPTENTVVSTVFKVSGAFLNIPIGSPIDNVNVYVLDRFLGLQPVGIAGELCVSGKGISLGYLNRPELTSERFIAFGDQGFFLEKPPLDPAKIFDNKELSVSSGAKIYRSGDLVRWLDNGNIEFLGRIDNQVKIRGFRIELGEIENKLLTHPVIKDAVVITCENRQTEKFIAAYIVCKERIDEPAVKEFLSVDLPEYMIPTFIVQLEKIPLTSNGKIDRKGLPDPGFEIEASGIILPRNEWERKLVDIWSELLGIEKGKIGIDDDFFRRGGHSLKAAILVARIKKDLQVQIPLLTVFQKSTIRGLAEVIAASPQAIFKDIPPVEKREYYPLSYNQVRLYIIYQMQPDSPAFHMPGVIDLGKEAGNGSVQNVLKCIVQRHESFRTSFITVEDHPYQVVHDHVEMPIELHDLSGFQGEDKDRKHDEIFRHITVDPFDLSKAPILRAALVKFDEDQYRVMFNMHHIISDGWSFDLLRNEFIQLYNGEIDGVDVKLPELPVQYKDFAAWHNRQLEGPEGENARRYWEGKLSGGVPVLQLPGDWDVSKTDNAGASWRFFIGRELKEELKNLATSNNSTLFTVMFSFYTLLFSNICKQEDVTCSIISAGRGHTSLHHIIGYFVNSIILRINTRYTDPFVEFLREVGNTVLEAFQYQEYPLEPVCEKLGIRYPEIPVSFNLINFGDTAGGGIIDSFEPSHTENARDVKFDIEVYVIECENGIDMNWVYRKNMFKPSTLEHIVKRYIALIEFFCKNPEKSFENYLAERNKPKIGQFQRK